MRVMHGQFIFCNLNWITVHVFATYVPLTCACVHGSSWKSVCGQVYWQLKFKILWRSVHWLRRNYRNKIVYALLSFFKCIFRYIPNIGRFLVHKLYKYKNIHKDRDNYFSKCPNTTELLSPALALGFFLAWAIN